MRAAGVPVTPGSDGPVSSVEDALAVAETVGYPVLLKASAGGGGRGIRRCDSAKDLPDAYAAAKAEANACFGNDEMYLEKLVLEPRHIEFQILADRQGHVIHLGDRDCSIQRRNQKLIEEAPARCLTPELREEMGRAAVKAAQAVRYEGAGTVEFLLDSDGQHFYFMEMNTRIPGGRDPHRPRHRVPHQRRGPHGQFPALPRQGGIPPLPRRPRRSGGLRPL